MDILGTLASAAIPLVVLTAVVIVTVLGRRFFSYARQSRQAREDARLLEMLIAQGYSPLDADEAVRATRG